MEFSRQEYWSGFPLLSPGDLSNPGMFEPRSSALQADSLLPEPQGSPKLPTKQVIIEHCINGMNECSHRNQGTKKDLFFFFHQVKSVPQPAFSRSMGCLISMCLYCFLPLPPTLPCIITRIFTFFSFRKNGREELAIHHGPY